MRINLYHSNDLHSKLEQWPKITSYFQNMRKHHEVHQNPAFFFDIGDHMDRANPISEATMGKANVQLMNQTGYHDVTIGNNEGITLSHEALDDLYSDAEFNVLVANLFYKDGTQPQWVKPYSIYQLDEGVKIGVIGLTISYDAFYKQLGWKVKDPFELLPSLIAEVKREADIIILLSHLGINEDERIAEEFDGIDVILGGHTHHLLKQGKLVNGTLLAGAGKHGMYIGEVILDIDVQSKKIRRKDAYVISLDTIKECEAAVKVLQSVEGRSKELLSEVVANLNEALDVSWFQPSSSTQILSEALKEWCNAEIAMVNAGVILEEIPKGRVTKEDLHRICPHPINPCKIVLRGDELKEVIHQAFTEKMQNLELKGLGFRGKVIGRMIFDGVEVETKVMADGLTHVTDIQVLGMPIDYNRNYIIATLDMFTFGYLYPELTHAKEKKYYLPEMLRDVLSWKLVQSYS